MQETLERGFEVLNEVMTYQSYDNKDIFLIDTFPSAKKNILSYRAIEIDKENDRCMLCFCAELSEYKVEGSKYKIVRDLLPLIKECIDLD